MTENQKIIDFLNELKSAAPAPGGGAVAALTGAQGAALIMMVANLTDAEGSPGSSHQVDSGNR